MKNPFDDFRDHQTREREIPLDSIIQSRDRVMSNIVKGYEKLLEEEVKELVWLVQYNTVIKAYTLAEKAVKDFDYRAEDIEEFCYELDTTDKIPYLITGPAGIYISALCNYAKEEEISAELEKLRHRATASLLARKDVVIIASVQPTRTRLYTPPIWCVFSHFCHKRHDHNSPIFVEITLKFFDRIPGKIRIGNWHKSVTHDMTEVLVSTFVLNK